MTSSSSREPLDEKSRDECRLCSIFAGVIEFFVTLVLAPSLAPSTGLEPPIQESVAFKPPELACMRKSEAEARGPVILFGVDVRSIEGAESNWSRDGVAVGAEAMPVARLVEPIRRIGLSAPG